MKSLVGKVACEDLCEQGLVKKGADGSWYLSRAGWELLLAL